MPTITLTPSTDVDQTASLQSQVDAISDGTAGTPTIIEFPAGRYRIDGGLRIDTRAHLRLTCLTGEFEMYTDLTSDDLLVDDRAHYLITRSTDIVGSFLRVEGPNDERDASKPNYARYRENLESDHAFAIKSGSVDCGYEDCTFTQVYGDGVFIGFHNDGVANENAFARRITGTYCGRQSVALTHVVGCELTDIDIQWGGRSGLDIEPNHAQEKVWDVTMTRCNFNSQFYAFAITGADNGALPQRRNYSIIDCEIAALGSAQASVLATRGPSDGTLLIDGLIDERQSTIYGLQLTGAWENITVQNCTITTSTATPTSYAVRSGATGELRIIDNVFNGKPGTEGFDELYQLFTATPTTFVHYGNVWAMGTLNDGEDPNPDPDPDPPVIAAPAYQGDGFQVDAFQATASAYQEDAFQASAFQIVASEQVLLVVADGAHGHTGDNLTLVTPPVLVISDGAHAHAADEVALVPPIDLAIADAAHGQAAEEVALGQVHALAIAWTDHAHAADEVTLGGVQSLVVADADHAQTADDVAIVASQNLTVADGAHVHTAEGVALTEGGISDIDDAAHAHAAEDLVLTQVHVLAIADAAHAQTAEELGGAQDHLLVVADAAHGHTAEALVPDQVHVLTIGPDVLAHAADEVALTQLHLLVVDGATHGHHSDGLALERLFTIVTREGPETGGAAAGDVLVGSGVGPRAGGAASGDVLVVTR